MADWFSFCGFLKGADALVFEANVPCPMDRVRPCLDAGAIADDPQLIYCYEIPRESVAALLGKDDLPDADYFVNACAPP